MEKSKKAWKIGGYYFAGLATIYVLITLLGGFLGPFDVLIFCFGILPLLVRRRLFLIAYGFLGSFLFSYLGIACLIAQFRSFSYNTIMSYAMGYGLALSGLVASLLLIYSAVNHDKNNFRFI